MSHGYEPSGWKCGTGSVKELCLNGVSMSFLVPLKGGRWYIYIYIIYIITQLAIYKWYIGGVYSQLGDYISPTFTYHLLREPGNRLKHTETAIGCENVSVACWGYANASWVSGSGSHRGVWRVAMFWCFFFFEILSINSISRSKKLGL